MPLLLALVVTALPLKTPSSPSTSAADHGHWQTVISNYGASRNMTQTSVNVSCPTTVSVNETVTCIAEVTGDFPTGLAAITSQYGPGFITCTDTWCECTLSAGACQISIVGISGGSDRILGVYNGDSSNYNSEQYMNITVIGPAFGQIGNQSSKS